MKLNSETIEQLNQLLTVSSLVSIDNIIIEDGIARGVNEDKTVVLISDQNIPSFGEGNKVGLSRLSMLATRLNLVKGKDGDVQVEVKTASNKDVTHLEISGSGAKVQYKCTASNLIKAPKAVNVLPTWKIDIPVEQLNLIQNGANAMGSKKAILNRKGGKEVFIEFVDTNQDAFTLQIADSASFIGEEEMPNPVFIYYYPAKLLVSLLKAASADNQKDITIIIGNVGTLQAVVSGHMLTVIPTMNND